MRYTVEVELAETPTEIAFSMRVLELPGCYSASESFEEIKHNLLEAITLYRECSDAPSPEPTSFLLQIEMPV